MSAPGTAAPRFDLQGHRGARGLEPENTLPAFARALAIGVTTLELDVGIAKDGHLVVSHERRVNPNLARDAEGRWIPAPGPTIASLTMDELRRFDVGRRRPASLESLRFPQQIGRDNVRLPSLREVIALTRRAGNTTVRFNIETKLAPTHPDETQDPRNFADALVALLRDERVTARAQVQSFDWRTLRRVQEIAPELRTVALTIASPPDDNLQRGRRGGSPWLAGLDADAFDSVPQLVKALGAPVWSPDHRDLTEASLTEAHALGLEVVPWTVDDPADQQRLISWGVDGLITDYPDRLRALLTRLGYDLPVPTPEP